LYYTLLVIGGEGVVHRHRKLMPTMHERVFHGVGTGDDLGVVELPGGVRVGGLICWEKRMPLARWRVYEGGPQIWLAPTADDSDSWIASMRCARSGISMLWGTTAELTSSRRSTPRIPGSTPFPNQAVMGWLTRAS
jgi:predicted amidohydrolase